MSSEVDNLIERAKFAEMRLIVLAAHMRREGRPVAEKFCNDSTQVLQELLTEFMRSEQRRKQVTTNN